LSEYSLDYLLLALRFFRMLPMKAPLPESVGMK